ncbi:MAG: MBL fold metallo-hydrolase [Chlorobi bacterium]|nr:MBL fold metallo-hydrolase [Chlorobiota bacterium]MCI0715474.1 MBL fold metallo-hydrolase [Chlorobiota bacterium]
MTTQSFTVNPFEMNCYIYWDDDSKEGVIIDPGAYEDFEKDEITKYIKDNGISIKLILNTHGHIDHILGNDWAMKTFNVPLLMHKDDSPLIDNALEQGAMFQIQFPKPPSPDKFIDESDEIKFAGTTLKILHTPGHSPGSVSFVDEKEKVIFGGDTVFLGSIGRTDLWMGDINLLLDSINNKIFKYEDDYIIYPGHMEETSVGEEKVHNPFLNGEFGKYV